MIKESVIAEVLPDKLNALVKNLMDQMGITDPDEAVRRMNAREWTVSKPIKRWREVDDVIYFTVVSDGTTGEAWITRLELKGFRIGHYAKSVLCSKSFKSTIGVYEIAVLKGSLFSDNERITENIRNRGRDLELIAPNMEVACLIREMFTDKELEDMDLWYIIVMHNPVLDSVLLGVNRARDGRRLDVCNGNSGVRWNPEHGFALVRSRVSST